MRQGASHVALRSASSMRFSLASTSRAKAISSCCALLPTTASSPVPPPLSPHAVTVRMNSAIPCCSTVNRYFIGANLRWIKQFASPFLGWPAGTEASRKAGWNIGSLAQGGARRHRDQWQDSVGGRRGTPRRSVDLRSLGRPVVPAGRDSKFWPPPGFSRTAGAGASAGRYVCTGPLISIPEDQGQEFSVDLLLTNGSHGAAVVRFPSRRANSPRSPM